VIDIQDKTARLRGLLSPGENFCDDISSSNCIDMDEGSIEDNEEKKILNKKYRTQWRMKNMTMTMIIISIMTSRSGLRLFGTWTDRQSAQYYYCYVRTYVVHIMYDT
jgi:hypothetical protein